MTTEKKYIDKIESYLSGDLSPEDKLLFEKEMAANENLQQQIKEYQFLFSQLDELGKRHELREKMDIIHHNIYNIPTDNNTQSATTNNKLVSFRKHIYNTITYAAAAALIAIITTLWIFSTVSKKNNSTRYSELKRDLDYIKRSQNAIIKDMKTPKAPLNPGTYGGTGFMIKADGLLATNYHVIENADSIYIQNVKGEAYKASVIYQDPVTDLAILKVDDDNFKAPPPLPYDLKTASGDIGEEVYTLGFPRDEIVYGKGYISAKTGFRGDTNAYQIAIPVNPGNSGGPLLDNKGNLLGIISGKQTPSDDIAFAVKSSFLNNMIDSLERTDGNNKEYRIEKSTQGLLHLSRVDQIKKLQDYVYMVKVYN